MKCLRTEKLFSRGGLMRLPFKNFFSLTVAVFSKEEKDLEVKRVKVFILTIQTFRRRAETACFFEQMSSFSFD